MYFKLGNVSRQNEWNEPKEFLVSLFAYIYFRGAHDVLRSFAPSKMNNKEIEVLILICYTVESQTKQIKF